ncbi:MAG TPA: AarF/UbiB family protein [Patescibacteria group bacterium]
MESFKRFIFIASILIPASIRVVIHKNNPESPAFKKAAINFREKLQMLGSTFIKFGQMMSARPDIVGQEFSNELRNLLDHEPAIPAGIVKEIIREELKFPFTEVFKSFEEEPIATASIGQVHKAVLHNGKKVAVKLQRPNIQAIIKKDLSVLKLLAPLLNSIFGGHGIKFDYLYKEFMDWILNELDFQVEGRRADKFRENMESLDGITIPIVYWKYTTEKLITMEFLEGRTLNEILNEMKSKNITSLYDLKTPEKYNADLLIKRTISAIAKQAFMDRYFHGDLHPANIIVQKNNKVAFVDFGIIGTLDNEEYTELIFTMLALVENDPEALLKAVMTLVSEPLSSVQMGSLKEDLSLELHKLHEDSSGKISMNHFILVALGIAQRYNMTWSPGVLLAIKTIGQVDFVAGQIGLKEPLVDLMKPEVEKYVTKAISSNISKEVLYQGMLDLVEAGKKLPQTLEELEQLITSGKLTQIQANLTGASRGSLSKSILMAFSSILISLPFIYSPFVMNSDYRPFITLGTPLLFFMIIATLFGKGEGVK